MDISWIFALAKIPPEWVFWFVGAAIASWLVLGALFLGFPTVERLKDNRDKIPLGWVAKTPIYAALFVGIVADVVFNWTWGTIIFREIPREFVFTNRLKRHHRGSDAKQKKRAEPWVTLVNMIDPGHV